jgi:sugar phosphate isomerase/epimerase
MSDGADVQHFLKKLFPQINHFHVKDGSIEKVGLNHELSFLEPLYFQ